MRATPSPLPKPAFSRLKAGLPRLTDRLTDEQLLVVTGRLHDILRARREQRLQSGLTHVHAGLNDNRALARRPNERPWFWRAENGSDADLFSQF